MATVMKWSPTRDLRMMRNVMDRMFEDFNDNLSDDAAENRVSFATPPLDIIDGDEFVEVHTDLPGVSPDNVVIEFKDGALHISAEVHRSDHDEQKHYTRRERYYGMYHRSLSLPDTLDIQNAKADFVNGVLVLRLPKKPESKPLRISIGGNKVLENGG